MNYVKFCHHLFYILILLEKKSLTQKIATETTASVSFVKIGALKVILYLWVQDK